MMTDIASSESAIIDRLSDKDRLNVEVAMKVMHDFEETGSLGYYGPPETGPWKHELSVRFDTPEAATEAYKLRWPDDRDVPSVELCYWKEGWGPLDLRDYADAEMIDTWAVVKRMDKDGWSFDLIHENGYPWQAIFYKLDENVYFDAAEDETAVAICQAAINAVTE